MSAKRTSNSPISARHGFVNSGAHNGRGTIKPPFPNNPDLRLWTETIPTDEYEALLLIRDAQLSSQGQLSDATIKLIAHNKTPQAHITTVDDDPPAQGASGEENSSVVSLASFFIDPHNFALCALCESKTCASHLCSAK